MICMSIYIYYKIKATETPLFISEIYNHPFRKHPKEGREIMTHKSMYYAIIVQKNLILLNSPLILESITPNLRVGCDRQDVCLCMYVISIEVDISSVLALM